MSDARRIAVHGVQFNIVSPKERDRFWEQAESGEWEADTFQVFDLTLRPGALHIDIGAWVGPTVLYAAARGARVIAFEPDPSAFHELSVNISANADLAKRITLHRLALSTTSGEGRLYFDKPGDSISRFNPHWQLQNGGWARMARSVACRTMDVQEAAQRFGFARASLIKIDIEGHEYALLPRMADFLRTAPVPVWLSLHPEAIGSEHANDDLGVRRARAAASRTILAALQQRNAMTVEDGEISLAEPSALERKIEQAGWLSGAYLFMS